ncbi:FCS-Like Zinc finger 7-like [Aristolochia californica]|uniref:FCS-Like Zinc finger 7-like n=1 Tax=Aristolochia californica TaxID=171875 RepID=UPI0035D59BFE
MLLGKRPRPPMRRTTSLTEFTVDLGPVEGAYSSDHGNSRDVQKTAAVGPEFGGRRCPGGAPSDGGFDPRFLLSISPRNHRRNSGEILEPAPFLRACGLCKRRLGPGKDIYMYRGDTAFCSLECRQQQMNQDERKEKCSLSSVKKEASQSTGSEASNKGETVAAA